MIELPNSEFIDSKFSIDGVEYDGQVRCQDENDRSWIPVNVVARNEDGSIVLGPVNHHKDRFEHYETGQIIKNALGQDTPEVARRDLDPIDWNVDGITILPAVPLGEGVEVLQINTAEDIKVHNDGLV